MATLAESKPAFAGEQRFLLSGISWGFYQSLCEELGERPVRLTYDCGDLELMITKPPHEYFKTLLAKLVEAVLFEFNIPVRSGGSMTFQREDLQQGYEHDECWWIAHEANVRGRREFDFRSDPPPDLAVEVEITHSLISRISIFAAMRVPEIWRFDGRELRFLLLEEDGTYHPSLTSRAFPFLKSEHLQPFLSLDEETDETSRIRKFVEWLRQQDFTP
jgi:Uma2 family endonuclease